MLGVAGARHQALTQRRAVVERVLILPHPAPAGAPATATGGESGEGGARAELNASGRKFVEANAPTARNANLNTDETLDETLISSTHCNQDQR